VNVLLLQSAQGRPSQIANAGEKLQTRVGGRNPLGMQAPAMASLMQDLWMSCGASFPLLINLHSFRAMNTVETPPVPVKVEEPPEHEKRDPITGAPHYHPVATGTGAAAGGALGAVAGSIGGPIGAAVGAAVGGLIGGLMGKSAAEGYDEGYWRTVYPTEPYFAPGYTFEDYEPAYRFGTEAGFLHGSRTFEEVESDLMKDWEKKRGASRLTWEQARAATRRAWHRVKHPGDGDDDNGVPPMMP
jgi:hypothetical protein